MLYYAKVEDDFPVIIGSTEEYESIPIECQEISVFEYMELQKVLQKSRDIEQLRDHLEETLDRIRDEREVALRAFDVYKTNVYFGILEQVTSQEREEIMQWYETLLNLPERVTYDNCDEISLPKTPESIKKYL